MTTTELGRLWGLQRDATRRRIHRLLDAGRIRCMWAKRTNVNGVISTTTVYVVDNETA